MRFDRISRLFLPLLLLLLLFPSIASALPGDVDGSGRVDGYDLIMFGMAHGTTSTDANWNPDADLDGDGDVDSDDLTILSSHFGNNGVSFGLWTDDYQNNTGQVIKLSRTGNLLQRVGNYSNLTVFSGNYSDGSVWVADSNLGAVQKLAGFDGAALLTVTGMTAYSVSVNSADGSVWVADYDHGRVVKLLPGITDGYNVGTDTGKHLIITGFYQPRAISVNSVTGTVWVADTGNNRVVRLQADVVDGYDIGTDSGRHTIRTGFSYPVDIAVNSADGTPWVADYYHNQVVKLDRTNSTELLRLGGFNRPQAVSINFVDGSVWVADTDNNQVVRLAADGAEMVRAGGFSLPKDVAVNPLDASCWVADQSHNQIVQLAPNGDELRRLDGLTAPDLVHVIPDAAAASKYPSAAAQLSATSVDPNVAVTFTGTGTDPDGVIVLYEWDFDGDGVYDYASASSGVTTHAYPDIGMYNPVLRVTDNEHLTATDFSRILRVGRLTVSAAADVTSGDAPLTVNLTGSFIDPVDGRINGSYQWDFEGDAIFDSFSSTTPSTSHTYTAGNYTATLKITDGAFSAVDSVAITVNPAPPVATAAGAPTTGIGPLAVALTGTGADADGTVVLYEWDFTNDGIYDWVSVAGGSTAHTYAAVGSYNAVFRVTDNDGQTATDSLAVEVTTIPPVPVADSDIVDGHVGMAVNFNAAGSSDADDAITTYEWNFEGECSNVDFLVDDMESGAANWDAANPWARITDDFHSATTAWTDSPGGSYADNTNASLTSKRIDLAGASKATLSFWQHYNLENGYDHGRVELSTDGGVSWTQIASYTGLLSAWTMTQVSLDPYLPATDILLRFRLTSDGSVTRDGWYIDDVTINGCALTWTASGDGTAVHTYNTSGSYNATLRLTDAAGNQAIDTVGITVYPDNLPLPTAAADVTSGAPPLTVNFTGSAVDLDGTITAYRWDFGEYYVWVADDDHNQVVRLDQDGNELTRTSGFNTPSSVSINAIDGRVWVADSNNNQVVLLAADGQAEISRTGGMSFPISLATNPTDSSVWVSDYYHFQIVHLADSGAELSRTSGFYYPQGVAVDTVNGDVWVADYSNNQVVRLSTAGVEQARVSGFANPRSVAVDPVNGQVWVAAYNGIVQLDTTVADGYNLTSDSGSHVVLTGFSHPYDVAVNQTDQTVWVADYYNSQVVHLDVNGAELSRTSGFSTPRAVAVNPNDGSCWVANTGNNEVVKLDANGNVLARRTGFDFPVDIDVAGGGPGNSFTSASSGNASHTYDHPGIYQARFTVTDNDGNTHSQSLQIRVDSAPTVIAAVDRTDGTAPHLSFFSGTASDLDGYIVKYEWDFDNNGVYDFTSLTTATTNHIYATAGNYIARLRVTDNDGYTDEDTVAITVVQVPPTVTATVAPATGNASLPVNFDGVAADADGSIALYAWDFDNNGSDDFSSSTSPATTHTYTSPGTYTAVLRVTDNDGLQATDSVDITVNDAGVPLPLLQARPDNGPAPLDVAFCIQGIDPDGAITSYEMDYDGNGVYDQTFAAPPTAFGDSMELNDTLWSADSPWARDAAAAHSGVYAWTDSPGTDYGNNLNVSLSTVNIDLSTTTAPKLTFWHRYSFAAYDYGSVDISTNDGVSWTQLKSYTNSTNTTWSRVEFDLANYRGATVKIRFQVETNNDTTADGWSIDDVWIGDCSTYTYQTAARYNPTLRVTDNDGKRNTTAVAVDVYDSRNTTSVYVAGNAQHQVIKLSDEGEELARYNGFYYPRAVTVDPTNGDIWVADTSNNRVVKLDSSVQNGHDVRYDNTPDRSPGMTSGVIYGDPVFATAQPGLSNGLDFDASGDYVQIQNTPPYTVGSFSMEAWIKPASFDGINTIFGKVSQGKDFALVLNGDKPSFLYYDGARRYLSDPTAATLNTWTHVAVTYDFSTNTLNLYVDGVLVATDTTHTPNPTNTDPLIIGRSNCCSYESFNGMIDDVRFWNVVRTGQEITDHKDAPLTGSESGLIGYWPLDASPALHTLTTGFNNPYYIDVDETDSSVWVSDYYHHQIVHLDSSGIEINRVSGFAYPRRLAIYQADRSVWVADGNNNAAVKLDKDGNELLRIQTFYYPYALDVDQTDGSVWVSSFYQNQAVKLDSNGNELYRVDNFNRPFAVSINQSDHTVWIADHEGDQMVKLTANPREIVRLSGFNNPHDVKVNPDDSTVWVADLYNDAIVKLAADGTELFRLGGFNDPTALDIDLGARKLVSPPTAVGTVTPGTGDAPLLVAFDAAASTDDSGIARFQWDFDGDATYDYDSAAGGNTSHTYPAAGTFNPILRITDIDGQFGYDASHTVYVTPLSVEVSATPTTGNAPLAVTFNAVVTGLAAGERVVNYEWDFDNDYTFDASSAVTPVATHTYLIAGSYTAVIRVTDSTGAVVYDTVTVTPAAVPPTVSNNATPTSGNLPLFVNLNGSGSDPDGSIVLYEWDYDGDGAYDWFSTNTFNTTHIYQTIGTYDAVLRVTDNDGKTAIATRTITVNASQVPPIAAAVADSTKGNAPLTVNFTGTGTDPDDNTITLYEWDFDGDGVYDTSSAVNGIAQHVYTVAGQYRAVLRVTDADALTATAALFITVNGDGTPTATAGVTPLSGGLPLAVTADPAGSLDPDGVITNYQWFFGDEKVWVAGYSQDQVRLVHNYQVEKILSGFDNPYRLALNPNDHTVWVSDLNNDQVVHLQADAGGELARSSGFHDPYGLAVDPTDNGVWVADYLNNQVVKLDSNGNELVRASGFNHPISVAVDAADSSVWVADYQNYQMVRLDAGGNEIGRYSGFNRPFWVTVDPADRSAVIADRYNHQIVRLAHDTPAFGYNIGNVHRVAGEIVGNTSVSLYNDAASTPGKINTGLQLDGSGDYVMLPKSSALDVQSFTLEAWIKGDYVSDRALYMRGNNSGHNEIYIGFYSTSRVDVILDNGSTRTFNGAVDFTDGSWHHVAVAHDAVADTLTCYVDGALYGTPISIDVTLDFEDSNGLIGADFDAFNGSLGNYFDGAIDDVRLWNTARTAQEIADHKDAALTGNEGGLAAYWPMDDIATTPFHQAIGGFNGPICTKIDPFDRSIWVCDYDNNQVVKLDKDLSREIVRVSGFNKPHDIAVNPFDGSVWVAGFYNNQIIKLSADGTEIQRVGGFNNPTDVEIVNPAASIITSATADPAAFSYNKIGDYLVTLRVTDNDGKIDRQSTLVTSGVFPQSLPTAYPTTGNAPLQVRFAANGSSPTGTLENFEWDYDGNGSFDWSSPVSYNSFHTYNTPGTYTATQRVTDNRGLSHSASITITVNPPDTSPTAQALADPREGAAPLTVNFTGLGSDTDGTIKQFRWDFTNDGSYDYTSAVSAATPYTYNSDGLYTARLQVTDNDNKTGTDTVTVEVKHSGAPTAQAAASPTSGNVTLDVDFTGTGTDNGAIVKYEWDFDGDSIYDWESAATGVTTHSYVDVGTFNAVLRVTDNDGQTDTDTVVVTVNMGITASLSNDIFDPTNNELVTINSVLTNDADVSVKVLDRNGALVRTLVHNVSRGVGFYADAWDGKDDNGLTVASGVYLYIIEYTVAGVTYVYDVTNDVDAGRHTPSVTYPSTFNPFSAETNFFRYTLDRKAEVTIYMSYFTSGAGARVKTLLMRYPQKAGSYVQVWDGTNDAGNLVAATTYVIAVFAWYLPDNAIIVRTAPVISDLQVTPTYFNPAALPYDDTNFVTFSFRLSKTADVETTILDADNFLIKTSHATDVPRGSGNAVAWDGTNENGQFVTPGVYRIKLVATDSLGNKSMEANTVLIVFY